MLSLSKITAAAALAVGAFACLPAAAHDHGGGVRFGFVWYGPGPYWGPSPYYYYSPPPVIVQQSAPLVVQPSVQAQGYWYYCRDSQMYYPYASSCPSGWQTVAPTPAPPPAPPAPPR